MVDILYTFTRTAETMIGGAFGALMYSISTEQPLQIGDIGLSLATFASAALLITGLYAWYERKRNRKFR